MSRYISVKWWKYENPVEINTLDTLVSFHSKCVCRSSVSDPLFLLNGFGSGSDSKTKTDPDPGGRGNFFFPSFFHVLDESKKRSKKFDFFLL